MISGILTTCEAEKHTAADTYHQAQACSNTGGYLQVFQQFCFIVFLVYDLLYGPDP